MQNGIVNGVKAFLPFLDLEPPAFTDVAMTVRVDGSNGLSLLHLHLSQPDVPFRLREETVISDCAATETPER